MFDPILDGSPRRGANGAAASALCADCTDAHCDAMLMMHTHTMQGAVLAAALACLR